VKGDVKISYLEELEEVVADKIHKANQAEIKDFLYPELKAFFPAKYAYC